MKMYQSISSATGLIMSFCKNATKAIQAGMNNSHEKENIFDRLRREIEQTREGSAEKTTINKHTAVNTFEKFYKQKWPDHACNSIDELTEDTFIALERWALDNGLKPNYVALHMRNLRAIINRINGRGIQLFRHVCTRNGQSEKRAVSEDTIHQIEIIKSSDTVSSDESRACAIFLTCFYGMGIPLIDAAYLKKKQYKDGKIVYFRQKTHRKVTIDVSPELARLLEELQTPPDCPYLLPILTSTNKHEAMKEYRAFYQKYRRRLHDISQKLDNPVCLTSYTPRHSWANIAYKNNVDINVIARALGHANTNITYAYIREIDDCALFAANEIVCRAILSAQHRGQTAQGSDPCAV